MPTASAAADPPLDPPGTREWSWGLWQVPKCGLSVVVPQASSCVASFARVMPPAATVRATTSASVDGTLSRQIALP